MSLRRCQKLCGIFTTAIDVDIVDDLNRHLGVNLDKPEILDIEAEKFKDQQDAEERKKALAAKRKDPREMSEDQKEQLSSALQKDFKAEFEEYIDAIENVPAQELTLDKW